MLHLNININKNEFHRNFFTNLHRYHKFLNFRIKFLHEFKKIKLKHTVKLIFFLPFDFELEVNPPIGSDVKVFSFVLYKFPIYKIEKKI